MKIKIPLTIIELEDDNYHLIVSSHFFDSTLGHWVIDTGASKTVFDKNLTAKYNLSEELPHKVNTAGIRGVCMESDLAEIKEVSWGKLKVKNFKVALIDLSTVNKIYSMAANLNICGLLGSDFLMKYNAIINYKKRRITLTINKKSQ